MSQRLSRSIAIQGSPVGLMTFPAEPFTPFLVPQFPVSQLHWLDHLSKLVMRHRQRCVAVTLILDANQLKWIRPQIPTQRCGRDGVCWSHRDEDYADRQPSNLIGGSYQSARVYSLDEAVALVPAVDGMHLINVHDDETRLYAFARYDGEAHAINGDEFIIDDVAYTLSLHDDQLVMC